MYFSIAIVRPTGFRLSECRVDIFDGGRYCSYSPEREIFYSIVSAETRFSVDVLTRGFRFKKKKQLNINNMGRPRVSRNTATGNTRGYPGYRTPRSPGENFRIRFIIIFPLFVFRFTATHENNR